MERVTSQKPCIIQAETGILSGTLHVENKRKGFTGEGYVTGLYTEEENYKIDFEVEKEGHYTITMYIAADGKKANGLILNGETVGEFQNKGDGTFEKICLQSIFLKEGVNRLEIHKIWGHIDIDSIKVEIGEPVSDSYYDVSSKLVNPYASEMTKKQFDYVRSIYGKKIMAGQYCSHNTSIEVERIHEFVGKYPAMRGFDFIHCTPTCRKGYTTEEVNKAKEWAKMGGLVTFSWHWFAPKQNKGDGWSFYVKDTDFDFSEGRNDDYDIAKMDLDEVKRLCDEGVLNENSYLLLRDIDDISKLLKELADEDIPVFWRPLHEAVGAWFWWGNRGGDNYKWLYNLIFDRMTYYHKLNNLIWVWNAQSKDWYVGDDRCDVLGTDIYVPKHNYAPLVPAFVDLANVSGERKIVALTENGILNDPDKLVRDNAVWSWFNIWHGTFLLKDRTTLYEEFNEFSMLKKVYNHDNVVTLDKLPKFR